MNRKIIIEVKNGFVEVISGLDDVDVELHDYDNLNTIDKDNPDCKYGHDTLGDYEITIL